MNFMIGQNRQAAFQQVKADQDYSTEPTLLLENTDITRLIHQLTEAIHQQVVGAPRRQAIMRLRTGCAGLGMRRATPGPSPAWARRYGAQDGSSPITDRHHEGIGQRPGSGCSGGPSTAQ
jgi:hypothetical protein